MSELADSGTLKDLFSGNKVPYRLEHVHDMWESFIGALHGVATIHNHNSQKGYLCFHQDLKPSNFFLFRSKDEKKPFSYVIKIGDFGSSHSRPADPAFPVESTPDKGATRTYGPPETYLGDTLDFVVESSADMWAIGCIIVEMAMWINGGKLALDDFRHGRLDETKGLKEHKSRGRSDCFHDGTDVLSCVKGTEETIKDVRRQHDNITSQMVKLALEFVLIGETERATARQLIPKMLRVLGKPSSNEDIQQNAAQTYPPAHGNSVRTIQHEPRLSFDPWSPDIDLTQSPPTEVLPSPPVPSPPVISPLSSPGPPNTDGSRPVLPRVEIPVNTKPSPPIGPQVPKESSEPAINLSFPFVSIDQLKQWIIDKKKQNTKTLPGRNDAKSFLDGRDFVFLLDNSRHTRKYRDDMKSSVTALTYLLKDIDRDGIEVANTSAPHDREKIKTQTQMSQFVERNFKGEIGVDCMIERALDAILEPIKSKWSQPRSRFSMSTLGSRNQGSRGVTVLIFTNGVWDHSSEGTCGAETPILSLIDSMREHKIPRTQVSIQFVQIGSEERGIRRLRILDDELSKDFDIVDTKPITASIWNILIGSIHSAND